jgi:hypothetical protein
MKVEFLRIIHIELYLEWIVRLHKELRNIVSDKLLSNDSSGSQILGFMAISRFTHRKELLEVTLRTDDECKLGLIRRIEFLNSITDCVELFVKGLKVKS